MNSVVTVSDLLRVNQDEYARRKNPEHDFAPPGFKICAKVFDNQSHHGATAFYNEKEKALLIAHRGSATLKDWIVTDSQIVFNVRETKADRDAVLFAERTMKKLDREGKEISLVIETGHSKGGRESQMVLRHLMQKKLEISCYSLTFNSATISSKHEKSVQPNNHINLRGNGGSFIKKDLVSSFRKQFGENIEFHNSYIKGPVSAHSINSFEKGLENYPNIAKMDVIDFIEKCKDLKNIRYIEQSTLPNQNKILQDNKLQSVDLNAEGLSIKQSNKKDKKLQLLFSENEISLRGFVNSSMQQSANQDNKIKTLFTPEEKIEIQKNNEQVQDKGKQQGLEH